MYNVLCFRLSASTWVWHASIESLLLYPRFLLIRLLHGDPGYNIDFLLPELEKLLITNEPRIVLLSGWYWYLSTKAIKGHYRVANVYDAFLTHAYAINRAAASLIIESRPFITADDWFYIRKKGVKIYAFLPHLLDQDWSGEHPTSINQEEKKQCRGMWIRKLRIYIHSFFLKVLYFMKRYEKP